MSMQTISPRPIPQTAPLVPSGAAYCEVPGPVATRRYAFLLVPEFTLLAFSAAVEPLRIANQLSQKPLYQWRTYAEDLAPVVSSSGVPIVPDAAFEPLDRDVSLFVCAGTISARSAWPKVAAAVQRHHRFGGVVGGICTGALALAKAGLLSPGQFTLHWENQPGFIELFPDLHPTRNRFETDGRVITCGGGAAATDMMLAIIARDHGPSFAALVSEMCLRHVIVGPFEGTQQRSSLSALLETRNPAIVEIARLMSENIETVLSIDALADISGYSRRHLERLFKATLDTSPSGYYRRLRMERARSLLSTTDMSLTEIAEATGFETVSHFAKVFRAQYGCAPSKQSQRIRGPRRP